MKQTQLKQTQNELLKKFNNSTSKSNKKDLYKEIMEIEKELENESRL